MASASLINTGILKSCSEVCQRILSLVESDSLLLHRNESRCLARSYSVVLDAVKNRVEDACFILLRSQYELEALSKKLRGPLEALHHVMQEGERCLQDYTRSSSSTNHMWLVDKALKLGISTDVVDVHLHDLLWCFSVLEQALHLGNNMDMDMWEGKDGGIGVLLNDIWGAEDARDDLSATLNFLLEVKAKGEGTPESRLADFIWHRLSNASDLEGATSDILSEYLWVDPEDLQRNSPIGQGGYGFIHEAKWLGGLFAVKDFFHVGSVAEFGREAVIQARLRHPNVIHLVCCTKNPRQMTNCSLVMELMQQDLRVLMMERMGAESNRPPFPLLAAVDLMLQIAKGMEYLHSLHIMHRDLKSSNILVSFPSGQSYSYLDKTGPHAHLKIADFGMSKAKNASSNFTSLMTGTTAWRAPEVFDEVEDNLGAKYTKKADVYSFGMVCFEILTGKLPFEGLYRLRQRVMGGERPKLPPDCPRALGSYIEKCWDVLPEVRPTFTQICTMLRYVKACLLLADHHATERLSCSLSSGIVCAHIEDMLKSIKPQFQKPGFLSRSHPLSIPFEMYFCTEGLREVDKAERSGGDGNDKAKSNDGLRSSSETSCTAEPIPESAEESTSRSRSSAKKGILDEFPKVQVELGLAREFSYEELTQATKNFSQSEIIGLGKYGPTFRGELVDGRKIAVKEYSESSLLGASEYLLQELRILCQLRHRNIVPLLGWCHHRSKLLLVNEFMPNGDLWRHIFYKKQVLGWDKRYKVAFQLASALKYLHQDSGCARIVHRDVKPSNVLLDSEWNVLLDSSGMLESSSTRIKRVSTLGYLDPEYLCTRILSPASDVYSFGVTMLVVACGREPLSNGEGLISWVRKLYKVDKLIDATDVQLGGSFDAKEMRQLLMVGLWCTKSRHTRPTIDEVLEILSGASEPVL